MFPKMNLETIILKIQYPRVNGLQNIVQILKETSLHCHFDKPGENDRYKLGM